MAFGSPQTTVVTKGAEGIKLSLQSLADPRLPFLEETMGEAAKILAGEIRSRAPGGIKAKVKGGYARHKGALLLATASVSHPGGRPMELGRTTYYRGFKGNNRPGSPRAKGSMKRGQAFTSHGQAERVYIGIRRGDAAVAAAEPQIEELFNNAILAEWERKQGGGA